MQQRYIHSTMRRGIVFWTEYSIQYRNAEVHVSPGAECHRCTVITVAHHPPALLRGSAEPMTSWDGRGAAQGIGRTQPVANARHILEAYWRFQSSAPMTRVRNKEGKWKCVMACSGLAAATGSCCGVAHPLFRARLQHHSMSHPVNHTGCVTLGHVSRDALGRPTAGVALWWAEGSEAARRSRAIRDTERMKGPINEFVRGPGGLLE